NLSTTTIVTVRDSFGFGGLFDEIFDFPMTRPRQYEAHSIGSGFLIHSAGYVVTNAHVVDRASECKVTFADGTELPATKVAVERKDDLAILKVDADRKGGTRKSEGPPFPSLKLGHSDDLMPGETVIAIGNPLGYQHTVTTGVISALNRELRFGDKVAYTGLIQTDASINPGNSGGPLLNVLGELIGINTAIRGDAQNIGFAIPVDRLTAILPEMLDIERLHRVRFGVHFGGDAEETHQAGVRVKEVDAGSAAAKAGVEVGDVVVAINGQPTPNFMEAFRWLDGLDVGKDVTLELSQAGGKKKSVKVPLEEIPQLDGGTMMWTRFGIRVRELNESDLHKMGLNQKIALLVTEVDRKTQAFKEGVAAGDLVTRFGGRPVTSIDALGHLLEQVKAGDRVAVGVWRIGDDAIVQVELPLTAR
ncbi:MAG TPA: trypsin-like peptidase domain-containing protein, partial [Phycisphaerae bacterium]|nr:trypsin-like peptidase domain-containing protein [Phycisphaerae bacterium]